MKSILQNWKTSLLGTGVLSSAIITYVQNPEDVKTAVLLAITGLIGLFAKDHDTHSVKE